MTEIYSDNGAAFGRRTRLFRNGAHGGVEWIYAVDYAGGDRRWYGYGMAPDCSIAELQADGMFLSRIESGAHRFNTELTPAGEQTVIPGCERDDARTGAKQMSLF